MNLKMLLLLLVLQGCSKPIGKVYVGCEYDTHEAALDAVRKEAFRFCGARRAAPHSAVYFTFHSFEVISCFKVDAEPQAVLGWAARMEISRCYDLATGEPLE